MAVYDFFLSRNSAAVTVNDYVGHAGRLFYDDAGITGLRISDGVTPGGTPFSSTALATASSPGRVQPGQGLEVDSLGILAVKDGDGITFDGSNNLTLDPATTDALGGIRLGPGVTLNANNQLVIDSEGLDFTFGNFSATIEPGVDSTTSAVLSSTNVNEPIVIRANGTGSVSVVGEFNVFPTNGSIGDRDPVFAVNADGDTSTTTLNISNSEDLGLSAPLNVTINGAGLTKTPAVVTGSVAQFTGRDDRTAILVIDTYGIDTDRSITGGELVFRTGRGTNASTTAVQDDDILGNVTAAGWASNGFGGLGVGGLRIVANENYTATARGSRLEFYTVPNGTIATDTVVTVDETGITLNRTDAGVSNATFITFDTSHVDDHTDEGTVCWSAEDGTLNIHHADGVVQQVGQEQYAYVINNTGSEIANGAVVRFDGADDTDGYRLEVAPFEADGAFPSLYGLGIATHTLSDGESGRITVFGKVRGIDTTGGGESWAVGNILYVSPTTAGALTNVKPTAPNNVVPVAAVLHVDATEGEIFVRPTIEQKMNYGRFARTTNVTADSTNTAYVVALDDTYVETSGISLGTPASRMVVDQSGLYAINVQCQCYSAGETGDETFHVWLRKNGTDVPRSMKRTSTTDNFIYTTLSYAFTLTLDADDYVEVAYAFTDTGLRFEAEDATGFGPSTSAVAVDINQTAL